jgi:cob(I)alamin adenosyltransferase
MVVLNKIYTKTGDAGETALGDGSRVAKHSMRVTAYGTVDELNATLGLARLHADETLGAQLSTIQNDLFDLGADLCTPNMEKDAEREYPALRIVAAQVERLESEIDAMNARLQPLRSFILPGGTAMAAHMHVCRTVARRAERLVVELATMESVNPEAVKYLNRLSDWFFVAGASPTTTARPTCCGSRARTADKRRSCQWQDRHPEGRSPGPSAARLSRINPSHPDALSAASRGSFSPANPAGWTDTATTPRPLRGRRIVRS